MAGLEIRETFVNATEHVQFGDSGWQPVYEQARGKLFRALQADYGRCISPMYIDRKTAPLPQTAVSPGIARPLAEQVEAARRWETAAIGWVFEKRMRYEGARPDDNGKYRESDFYTREVWVEVRET